MFEQQQRESQGPPTWLVALAAAVLLAIPLGFYIWYESQAEPDPAPILTEQARDYLPFLDLSHVEMRAVEGFLENELLTIEGSVTNNGDKAVELIEVNCVFRDPYEAEVGRERVRIVSPEKEMLDPGRTLEFRLAFDNPPLGWNQTMPDLYIARIVFH